MTRSTIIGVIQCRDRISLMSPEFWAKFQREVPLFLSYCQVYGVIHFTSPAGWLPVHWDQLRAQRSVTSMWKFYLFLHTFMHAFIGALAKTFSDLLAIDFYCSLFLVYMKYITSTFVDVASMQTDFLYITKITYVLVSYYVSVCCSSALSVCVLFYLFCRFSSYMKFAAAIGEYVCSPLKQMMQTLLHPFCPFPVTS